MSVPRVLGLGAISGLRSISGPAFVSRAASRGGLNLGGTRLAFLGSPRLSKALVVMAQESSSGKATRTRPQDAPAPLAARPLETWEPPFVSEARVRVGDAIGSSAAGVLHGGREPRALVGRKWAPGSIVNSGRRRSLLIVHAVEEVR